MKHSVKIWISLKAFFSYILFGEKANQSVSKEKKQLTDMSV